MAKTQNPAPAQLDLTVPGLDHDYNLRLILSRQDRFSPSSISTRRGFKRVRVHSHNYRNSLSLEDDPDIARISAKIESHIAARLDGIVETLGGRPFRPGKTTASCVCFRNGSFFHRHVDAVQERHGRRRLSWVYYLNAEPRRFGGGDLILYGGSGGQSTVEPAHGRIAIFRSEISHEVTPVVLSPDNFGDARFTITGFVSDRATPRDALRYYGDLVRAALRGFRGKNRGSARRNSYIKGEIAPWQAQISLYLSPTTRGTATFRAWERPTFVPHTLTGLARKARDSPTGIPTAPCAVRRGRRC